MKINVSKIRTLVSKLDSEISDYEDCMTNIYNEFNQVSSFWKGKKSENFCDSISFEKKDVFLLISTLKSVNSLYNYILKHYEKYGNMISFNFDYIDKVNSSFDKLIEKLIHITNMYDNLYFGNSSLVADSIRGERNKIVKIKNSILKLREKVNDVFNDLKDSEKAIRSKASDISVPFVQENNLIV